MRQYNSLGLKLEIALQVADIAKSSYYYRCTGGKKGNRPSDFTVCGDKRVSNEKLVNRIKEILSPEFIDYGYKRTTAVLKNEGYQVGKSKVYRLMKENHLLNPVIRGKHPGRKYVVFTSPQPDGPFRILETDIKYVHIYGQMRNAYLISLFDTFHRQVYQWGLFENMKTDRIIQLILNFIDYQLIPNQIDPREIQVIIRTDNGSQFIADKYKALLKDCHIKSQYIPPATPQMNGHIEAFHNTVQKLVCNKYRFESYEHAKEVFERFFYTYNNKRVMESILFKSPVKFLELWKAGKIEIKKQKGKNKFFLKEEDAKYAPSVSEEYCVKN